MKPFSFSLQPVLDYRREIEGQKQRTLAEALQQLRRAEDDLAALREKFKRYGELLRAKYTTLQIHDLQRYYIQMEDAGGCIRSRQDVIVERRIAVQRARMEFVTASKERRIIETLKARRLAEYRARQAAAEENDLDEANRLAYALERGSSADGQIGLPTWFSFYAHGGG